MHFAHQNRHERREQQRDVSPVGKNLTKLDVFCYFTLFLDLFSPSLFVGTGRFCSARPADALTNPHHCFCSQPVDGDAASIQP